MMTYDELQEFFTGLIARAQSRGITCAITSGMACVHFGVAEGTKDCDVLCATQSAEKFLDLIAETKVEGLDPRYRGNISPPLDARWMRGGWTSHFTWKTKPDETCLDVFGVAPRASTHWEDEIEGIYASRHTVAEMKRTNRDKDWPFVTALGVKLLNAGNARGWLHLCDEEVIRASLSRHTPPPAHLCALRPLLQLAVRGDERVGAVMDAEKIFWHKLDACRIRIYERALRPYVSAVRKAMGRRALTLRESHDLRVDCALRSLRQDPIREHGFERLASEAREATIPSIHPASIEWLPDIRGHFIFPP